MTLGTAAAVLLGVLAAASAGAQPAEPVTADVGRCVAIQDPAERLACYEHEVDEARQEHVAETPQPEAAAPAPPAAPATPSIDISSLPRDAEREVAEAGAERLSVEYFGTIESVRELEPNVFLVTLDSGQVWRQVESKMYRLKPGARVRVYPTIWGYSFRLTVIGQGGFIQVRRVE
jgi:hypothetical protein